MTLVKKPEPFSVDPTFLGKSAAPLGGGHIPSFVPTWVFDPVEEFSQTRSGIFRGATLQQRAGHSVIPPGSAHDSVEKRRVPAKAIAINRGASIHICAMREQPIEDLPLMEIHSKMQQGGAINRRPMQARPVIIRAAAVRWIDFTQRKSALNQFRIASQVFLQLGNVSAMKRHHLRIG